MSKGDIIYLSAFDNGDARGMEQPALPEMTSTSRRFLLSTSGRL